MIRKWGLALLLAAIHASLGAAQDRSSAFAVYIFDLNPKYLVSAKLPGSYQIEIIRSTDRMGKRAYRNDGQGRIRVSLVVGNTYELQLQGDSRVNGFHPLFTYPVTVTAPMECTIRVPEDIPHRLDRFLYDIGPRFYNEDAWVRTRTSLDPLGYGEPFSFGHPALWEFVMRPSERNMSLPSELPFAKGTKSLAAFPNIPYDQWQEPLMLGLVVNDTDADLSMYEAMVVVQAQDANGQWQPIEGPDMIVRDTPHAPIIFPAHSCRNFPIRRYAGPFKTHLRVLFQEPGSKEPMLTSEPFEGSIYPEQIRQTKKAWAENRHW